MKTERRHELQTNWLADRVGEFLKVVQPYSKALLGVLLAALVLWVALLIMSHRAEAEQASGWNKLWGGMLGGIDGRQDLESLAESNAKQPTSEWARLILADNSLSQGVTLWFKEKAAGRNSLNTALDMYQSVLKDSTDPLVREHAIYGVGRTEESLCKVSDAIAAYKQLRLEYPNGSYAARAKQRLDSLSRESTEARYDWFAKIEPPANAFGKEGDKGLPEFPAELQPSSQFTAPRSKTPPPEPKPDSGVTTPKTPASKAPAPSAGTAQPASAPKDSKPAAAAPATTAPATTAPATPTPASSAKPGDKSAPPATSGSKP